MGSFKKSWSFTNQILLFMWWWQEAFESCSRYMTAKYKRIKSYVFEGYAAHVVFYDGDELVHTLYNYDNFWTLVRFAEQRLLWGRSLPMIRVDDVIEMQRYNTLVFKYYKDGEEYFRVVKNGGGEMTSEHEEQASFHHLHTPHTMAFVSFDGTDCDTVIELSREFTEVGILLAKNGVQVGMLLKILAEFYGLNLDTRYLPNLVFNVMLPNQGLCVYKENEKIVV